MTTIQSRYKCSLTLAHSLIGGKWKIRILWHIIHGDNRFSALRRSLPDISEKVLYTNLRELESRGLIYKQSDLTLQPPAVMYYISDKHNDLTDVINTICLFTDNYAANNNIEIS